MPRIKNSVIAIGDQFLTSGSNMAFVIVASHASSSLQFGAFSIMFAAYVIVLGVMRSLATDPLFFGRIRYADVSATGEAHRSALAASVLIGLVGGVALGIVSLFLYEGLSALILTLGLGLPLLFAQEVVRVVAIMRKRFDILMYVDLAWVIVQFAPSLWLLRDGRLTLETAVWIWVGSAGLSAIVGARWLSLTLSISRGPRWLWFARLESRGMLLDFIAGQGVLQVSILAVGALVSPVASGAVRMAQTALGPASVLVQGAQAIVAPRLSANHNTRGLRSIATIGGSLSMVALALGAVLVALPDDLGVLVAGESWTLVSTGLLLIFMFEKAVSVFAAPFTWVIRHRGAASQLGQWRVLSGGMALLLAMTGAAQAGVTGLATGLAIGTVITTVGVITLARRGEGAASAGGVYRGA